MICHKLTLHKADVADELNITTATIYKWRKILLSKGVAGLIAKPSKKKLKEIKAPLIKL